ncbi:MAG: DUF2189 domain-containing protein [Pseudomonadota bacterium]
MRGPEIRAIFGTMDPADHETDAPAKPFVVPTATLAMSAPFVWLKLGWRDFRSAQVLSLQIGGFIWLLSSLISICAAYYGSFILLAALLSGFVFLAPLLAVGLYSVARAHEHDKAPRLIDALRLMRRVLGQAGVFALVQVVILMIWSRSGMVLNAVFMIERGELDVFLQFLAVGSAIGAVFASLTFALTVFSLPMIADRNVDMITACVSSINAVLRNKRVALLWASLIAALTFLSLATLGLGLIIVMPWLGYAAWHSYRETLDASDWPTMPV